MNLDSVIEHMVIRETIGYKEIEKIDIVDLPEVMSFLKIVWNYEKMVRLEKNN